MRKSPVVRRGERSTYKTSAEAVTRYSYTRMQVKDLGSSSEILHAAARYSLVILAEVYITTPDVVPISLALNH
jgi:hypothetical protein